VLKRKAEIFTYMFMLGTLSWAIGISGKAYAQSVAEQCKKPGLASNVIGCSSDRPCILRLRQNAKVLQVGWDGQKDYDAYNLRWSKSGRAKSQSQIELEGGAGGIYEISNIQPCATYSLGVRGCDKLLPGKSRCSAWATASFITQPELLLGPDSCQKAYVWRAAYPGDHVCVPARRHNQAVIDNEQANSRRDLHVGQSVPDGCISGYVWREARAEDHVCVTPETRSQVQADNNAKCEHLAVCRRHF